VAPLIPIASASDAYTVRQTAKEMASAIGFGEQVGEEIALAVSELASNLLKHARGGELRLSRVEDNGRLGIRIESHDLGPGIADVEQAMTDGFSTVGGRGYGLGAVNRLMDQFEITSRCAASTGTHIVCTRWLRVDAPVAACPLEFGLATRPRLGMTMNGDAFVIKRWDTSALVGVIDGLGHGKHAHHAAQKARQYVETHFDQPLDAVFRGVGRTCRATRGVVMALARFEFGGDSIRFSFASVGNVEARFLRKDDAEKFIVRRGVLGGNAPSPRVTEHHWKTGNILMLFSDGVSQHWSTENFPELTNEAATVMAERLLRIFSKENDDATLIVVKDKSRE
jgi:anti-sigma regulatory factor (Ser/Thr protein kinase)